MAEQQLNPEQVKQLLLNVVKESDIPPEVFVQLGKIGEQVLQNPKMYQQFGDAAVRLGVAQPEDFGPEINYQMLLSVISLGRISQSMAGAA